MKPEAITHTKMKRLCRRLGLALWQGVGLLECLWQLTAREAPRGNIGKLSDEDIALGIDYRGKEGEMIQALVDSGWLDRHPEERLVVHDWADHADDAVQMRLARNREFFVGGRAPKLSRLSGKERDSAVAFYGLCRRSSDRGSVGSAVYRARAFGDGLWRRAEDLRCPGYWPRGRSCRPGCRIGTSETRWARE
jgi:hypothetical protein